MAAETYRQRTGGNYRIGIDLGSGSVGWTALLEKKGEPAQLLDIGARRFEPGVLGDIESGKDESRATARRDARGPRRLTWRRQYRMRKLFRLLQRVNLLPPSENDSHDQRHQILADFDKRFREASGCPDQNAAHAKLPYLLRARALDEKRSRHELGRAIYHLAQRRGFLSNLKAAKKDEDVGVVKAGISELAGYIDQAGSRTIGEYFASIDPEEIRIRGRWTARWMYEDEFQQIWAEQSKHHDDLTEEVKEKVHEAIFFQRPLKSQKGLIGMCDLEPRKRRAPAACLAFQEFRILQRVNDLEVTRPDSEIRPLTDEQREKLIEALAGQQEMTYGKIRTLLGMKKSREYGRNYTFNFEEGGDKKMVGNRTAAKMIEAIGDRWTELSADQQNRLVDDVLSFESEEPLIGRLMNGWGFYESQARAVAETPFEPGYGALSRKAIAKLVPLMREGERFATARERVYQVTEQWTDPVDFLPAKHDCAVLKQLRNPAVERALSELRKVINALIRKYGKPSRVYIEFARDLKHGRKARQNMTDRNKKNLAAKERAKKRILDDMGDPRFCTETNLLKVRLADESNWECPYTGRSIATEALVGDRPQFDVEHIIPFSRSLNNSFANKTLCYHEENRKVKGNKTPYETYHGTDRWDEIITRVKRFSRDTGLAAHKLAIFQTEKLPDTDQFSERQLNDTRYMSRLAADYLGLLYGGQIDEQGHRRIRVSPGRVTSYLRQRWSLNSILGHADKKERADHRHHAIDAAVVAVTGAPQIRALSQAAEEAEKLRISGLFPRGGDFEPPWEGFLDELREAVDGIIVSSRVSHKLNGKLHKDTIFSKPIEIVDEKGKKQQVHHVRKPIASLSAKEVENIVDDHVRRRVEEQLKRIGGTPDKAFKDKNNHPYFKAKDGRIIPIHKVRIRKTDHPMIVGSGTKKRYVNPGANHHMEIVALLDKDGNEKKWEGHIVSNFEAIRRHRAKEPIIQRDHGENKRFKFSLAGGDHVEMEHEEGKTRICRVTVISAGRLEFVLHSDARPITVRKRIKGARIHAAPDKLRKSGARKVSIDPLGSVLPAND